jgi:hypothetical protein
MFLFTSSFIDLLTSSRLLRERSMPEKEDRGPGLAEEEREGLADEEEKEGARARLLVEKEVEVGVEVPEEGEGPLRGEEAEENPR